MRRVLVVAVALVAVLAVPALAARHLHVKGPRTVRVGDEVVFPTTGFKPHERITVNLAPTINRGGNCCGIDVITKARADAHGRAILHFRWPDHYYNGPDREPWADGAKADVLVLTPAYAEARRVVRVFH